MVEMIAIFGCIGWLILFICGWLGSLPCFPAIIGAAGVVPVITFFDYRFLARAAKLRGILVKRPPIPPERFYWCTQQRRLRGMIQIASAAAIVSWTNVGLFPASLECTGSAFFGWTNALIGIFAASRLISSTALFFRASQWFDTMKPTIIGLMRTAMYKLSDNYEYLAPQKRDPEKEEVY